MHASDCCVGVVKATTASACDEKSSSIDMTPEILQQLRVVAGICNAGEFDAATMNLPLRDRKIIGDATDQAVLRFSESLGSVHELRTMWRKRFDLAFNSKNKFMIRVHSINNSPEALNLALPVVEASSFNQDTDM